MTMSMVKGRPELEKLMQQSDKLIMVKFMAPHCSGCSTLALLLHQIAMQQENNLDLVEIDMTEEPELAIEMKVRSAPTVIFFKNQQLLANLPGVQPRKIYQEIVQRYL
jgi:thioredoxin 1